MTELTARPSALIRSAICCRRGAARAGRPGCSCLLTISRGRRIELERFEGMRVRVENGRATAPSDDFGDMPIVADSTRTFREPGIVFPGCPGFRVWDGNPEVFEDQPRRRRPAGRDGPGRLGDRRRRGTAGVLLRRLPDLADDLQRHAAGSPLRSGRARPASSRSAARTCSLLRCGSNHGSDDGPGRRPRSRIASESSLHIRKVLGAPDVLAVEEVENLGAC